MISGQRRFETFDFLVLFRHLSDVPCATLHPAFHLGGNFRVTDFALFLEKVNDFLNIFGGKSGVLIGFQTVQRVGDASGTDKRRVAVCVRMRVGTLDCLPLSIFHLLPQTGLDIVIQT